MDQEWRKCGVCKKSILFNQIYQKCSISTCRKSVFCSVDCWSVHDSVLGHKSAYAEEERAPTSDQTDRPRRRVVVSSGGNKETSQDLPMDTLIVVSKLKSYVKAKGDMNTSGDVADEVSKFVRILVNEALDNARAEGRKTLMARDFEKIKI
jgi:histone H3/H4